MKKSMQSPVNQEEKNSQKRERLRFIIKKVGLKTDLALATALGYTSGYMSEILNEKKNVPKTMGQRIEDAFGIRRQWFETGEEPVFAPGDDDSFNPRKIFEESWLEEAGSIYETPRSVLDSCKRENESLKKELSSLSKENTSLKEVVEIQKKYIFTLEEKLSQDKRTTG